MWNFYRYGGAWGYITDTPGAGLIQLGARFYWPAIGRFVQQDPAKQGMNWYAYAGDDPVTGIDPSGLANGGPGKAPNGRGGANGAKKCPVKKTKKQCDDEYYADAQKCKERWKVNGGDMVDAPAEGAVGGGVSAGVVAGVVTGPEAAAPAAVLGAIAGFVGGAAVDAWRLGWYDACMAQVTWRHWRCVRNAGGQ